MADDGFKTCKVCGERRPLDDFYRASGCVDGRRGDCRACFQAKAVARAEANPELRERARDRTRQWIEDNRERYDAYKAAYRQTDNYAKALRKWHLKTKYGLTPEDYERMLEAQGGGCALCGDPPRTDAALHVDHDHDTGWVRALLCFRCNAGLGQFRHDPALLLAAAEYVGLDRRRQTLAEVAAARLPADHPDAVRARARFSAVLGPIDAGRRRGSSTGRSASAATTAEVAAEDERPGASR